MFPEFSDLIKNYDIFCTVETKLDMHDIISLQGYQYINCPRKQTVLRKSGGIGVYIKNELFDSVSHLESQSDYITWIKISKMYTNLEQDLLIGVCYVPPQSSRYYNEDDMLQLEEEIMSFCSTYEYVYITGDFNAQTARIRDFTCTDASLDKYLDLDQQTIDYFDQESFLLTNNILVDRASQDNKINNVGYRLVDICKNNNLYILNGRYGQDKGIGKYTFRDQSVIDYSITSPKGLNLLTDFEVQELDRIFSDGHSLLQMSLKFHASDALRNNASPTPEGKQECNKKEQNPQKFCKWNQQTSNLFNENINDIKLQQINIYLDSINSEITQTDMNEITQNITKLFSDSAERTFVHVQTNNRNKNLPEKNHKPWFGYNCKKARKLYNRARKLYQCNRNIENRKTLLNASKNYKKVMNKYITQYERQQQTKLRTLHKKSPKEYWKILNSLDRQKQSKMPPLNSFLDFFKNLNTQDESMQEDDSNENMHIIDELNLDDDDQLLNSPITAEEISKCILNLKNSKAPGSDQIVNEYIKYSKNQLLPLYVRLFNIVLNTGVIPEQWTEGMIKPIYKNKGDTLNPENYRPITLLSCLGKLFTAVLNERLNVFLADNNILLENQAGFRKHYSTTDHIFVLQSLFELLKLQKKKLYCAFIDFSKAFDSVWRIGLWQKLLHNEINGKFFRVIYNLYQNIKSCISLKESNSSFFESCIGLRQGENLSPVLFSIFLNDLENYLQSNNTAGVEFEFLNEDIYFYIKFVVLLYADDTVLLCDSPDDLQKCLNDFIAYCRIWKLNINYDKTKIVIFGSRKIDKHVFKMDNNIIEIVKSYKYLGVIMTSNGSFLNARKCIYEKASKAMHLLHKRIQNLNLPLDLQLKLFDSTILPIITYGCEIWGYENLEMFERIHTKFLRSITKCRKSTPLYMLYGELGRYPLKITIKTRIIGFWTRIITGNQYKFVNLLYQKLYQIGVHQFKWLKNVQSILQEVGRNDLWIKQNEVISKNTQYTVKQILMDQFVQKWRQSLTQSSKAINYSLLKDDFIFEQYLTILPKNKYIPLIKYRTANHFLPVETLRWQAIDISDRKCTLCNKQDTADEFHFLFICEYFESHRKLYIKPYYYKRPNILKYKELFSSKSPLKLSNLSKFASLIMKEFKRQ